MEELAVVLCCFCRAGRWFNDMAVSPENVDMINAMNTCRATLVTAYVDILKNLCNCKAFGLSSFLSDISILRKSSVFSLLGPFVKMYKILRLKPFDKTQTF